MIISDYNHHLIITIWQYLIIITWWYLIMIFIWFSWSAESSCQYIGDEIDKNPRPADHSTVYWILIKYKYKWKYRYKYEWKYRYKYKWEYRNKYKWSLGGLFMVKVVWESPEVQIRNGTESNLGKIRRFLTEPSKSSLKDDPAGRSEQRHKH